jgi:hypothetical protein
MAWSASPWGAVLLPTYLHLFVVGWITQIIIGVALWLFPKWSKEQPRGREWMSWVALITLNVGLLLRLVAEPLNTLGGFEGAAETGLGWALVASSILQWVGGMSFMLNIWGRIQPKKKRARRKPENISEKKSSDKNSSKTNGGAP